VLQLRCALAADFARRERCLRLPALLEELRARLAACAA